MESITGGPSLPLQDDTERCLESPHCPAKAGIPVLAVNLLSLNYLRVQTDTGEPTVESS